MQPFTSGDERPPRRNARSFDLDDTATKAAAWVWHLHESKPGVTTEGRFLSSQSRRRSSSSCDRKSSRFRQEAAAESSSTRRKGGGAMNSDRPMWDCGSNLYDAFELVAFGNRLDRSLMEVVPLTTPPLQSHVAIPQEHHIMSPLHESAGRVPRTLSLPQARRRSSKKKHAVSGAATNAKGAVADASKVSLAKSRELSFSVFAQEQLAPKSWWPSVGKLMKAFKKVVVLHKQVSINVGCKQAIDIVEPSQRPLEVLSCEDIRVSNSKGGRDSPSPSHHEGDDLSSMQTRIKARRNSVDDELLGCRRTKGSVDSQGTNHHVKEWSELTQSQSYHKHLHHHHHHHHHHYLHHTLASESARLSPETMSQVCTENSWL